MSNDRISEQNVLRAALGPGRDCLSIEELEQVAAGVISPSSAMAQHVQSCSFCQTELQMLELFHTSPERPLSEELRKVTSLLQVNSSEIFAKAAIHEPAAVPWWKTLFTMRRFAQAAATMAAVLLIASAVVVLRTFNNPSLNETSRIGQETFRTGNFNVVSPVGDVQERPKEIRWERVQNASTYQIHLLEVDRSEVWNARTTENHIDLPASIRTRVIPAKRLFCEVNAFDSSGVKVGGTGLVDFRLVQDVNRH